MPFGLEYGVMPSAIEELQRRVMGKALDRSVRGGLRVDQIMGGMAPQAAAPPIEMDALDERERAARMMELQEQVRGAGPDAEQAFQEREKIRQLEEGAAVNAAIERQMRMPRAQDNWVDTTGAMDRVGEWRAAGSPAEPAPTARQMGELSGPIGRRTVKRTPEEKEWSRQAVRNRGIAEGLGMPPALFPFFQGAQGGDPQAGMLFAGGAGMHPAVPVAIGGAAGDQAKAEAQVAAMELARQGGMDERKMIEAGLDNRAKQALEAARMQFEEGENNADRRLNRELGANRPHNPMVDQLKLKKIEIFGAIDKNNPDSVEAGNRMADMIDAMILEIEPPGWGGNPMPEQSGIGNPFGAMVAPQAPTKPFRVEYERDKYAPDASGIEAGQAIGIDAETSKILEQEFANSDLVEVDELGQITGIDDREINTHPFVKSLAIKYGLNPQMVIDWLNKRKKNLTILYPGLKKGEIPFVPPGPF